MKTFKTNLLGLALVGLILGSCSQTGTFEDADLMNEQAVAEKGGFNLSPFGMNGENAQIDLTGGGDPLVDCITDESGNVFSASGSLSGQWGNPNNPNEKTLEVEVWNTLTTIEYRFTLISEDMNNSGNLQYLDETVLDQNGDPTWVNAGSLTFGVPFPVSRPLPAGWSAGDEITEQWRNTGGGGAPLEAGDVTYALIGICTETSLESSVSEAVCENTEVILTASVSSFGDFTGGIIEIRDASNTVVASQAITASDKDVTYSVPTGTAGSYTYTAHYVGAGSNGYKDSASDPITVVVEDCGGCDEEFSYEIDGNDVTFTYIPAEDINGANLVFTFPQSALDGDPLEGWTYNGQTMQTTMDLEACETYTWTVSLSCKDLNNPQNKWTDFNVNGVSKKVGLENIKCD